MAKRLLTISVLLFVLLVQGQQSSNITFTHDGKTVNGTFSTPAGNGPYPTIIINPGSGANDRDGTIPMVGGNVACLYPALLNDTLRPYLQLANMLVDSGYAVLRYDKLEYTYPTTLGTITFHKLWLPVESAIDYVKTRADVDTTNIILIGHSEGSSLIPFIAKGRSDVKALISLAGSRTPFDSLLAYQLVNIAQTCGGNVSQAQTQANQVLSYFNTIRTNTWNGTTPALFGAPASTWFDYVRATDSVAVHYNNDSLPTLFVGMGLDINVPPAELARFASEVTITSDFWSMPGLVHFMNPDTTPIVAEALGDTIIYWLRHRLLTTTIDAVNSNDDHFLMVPNPVSNEIVIRTDAENGPINVVILNAMGGKLVEEVNVHLTNERMISTAALPQGIYYLSIANSKMKWTRRFIKQ